MKRLFILVIGQWFLALPTSAAVIYSGLQNIAIPTDFTGIYINLDNAATGTSPMSGWDFNPFFGGAGAANSAAFQPARTGSDNDDPAILLTNGDLVSNALNFSTGFGGFGDPVSHLGGGPDQFGVGQEGYLGFLFTADASTGPYYGWMRVAFTNNAPGGIIMDWAYDNTGSAITVQSIPEPSRALLLMAGTFAARFRRRR